MKGSKKVRILTLLMAISLFSIGCSSTSVSTESTSGDKGSMTITTDNGKTMTLSSEAELPKEFPADIPMPKDVVITASMTNNDSGNVTVSIEVEQPFDDVVKLYQEYANAAGYQEMMMLEEEGHYMFSGKRDNELFVFTIGLDQEDNKTVTGALVYEKKP